MNKQSIGITLNVKVMLSADWRTRGCEKVFCILR
jgi:hypothetical protein